VWQDGRVADDAGLLEGLAVKFGEVLPHLDERQRRLYLGSEARALGRGGVAAVARVSGVPRQTVAAGAAELAAGEAPLAGRARRPGGGRKRAEEKDPGLAPALLVLVEEGMRGDPESPLTWTTKSLRHLAGELTVQGHRCGPDTVRRLLRGQGFSLQANAKTMEGAQHPDRDAQFRYIAGQAREHMAAGQPVISVDAKKREQAGPYARPGREWRRSGDPVRVRSHDFPDEQTGTVIPYGVYDLAASTGFVNVGTDHNTAAFAAQSIGRWWEQAGRDAYRGAARLLITADAGGSNGYRTRAWKSGLAELAAATGLEITVCHFPPGTSKWNKIEHRLFSAITMNWRGRPLTSHQVVVETIAATTTTTGLKVTARLDDRSYPAGIKITRARMQELEQQALTRHHWHPAWNYTLRPPAASPAPAPHPSARPATRRCSQHTLCALTGLPRHDLDALITALDLPLAAHREQRLYTSRGGPRKQHSRAGQIQASRKLDHTDHILATVLKLRYGLPSTAMTPLFGADPSTIRYAIKITRDILTQQDITIPASPVRCRTLPGLLSHAAARGITIPASPAAPPLPQPGPETTQEET
jgi:hypothetical protein